MDSSVPFLLESMSMGHLPDFRQEASNILVLTLGLHNFNSNRGGSKVA